MLLTDIMRSPEMIKKLTKPSIKLMVVKKEKED